MQFDARQAKLLQAGRHLMLDSAVDRSTAESRFTRPQERNTTLAARKHAGLVLAVPLPGAEQTEGAVRPPIDARMTE